MNSASAKLLMDLFLVFGGFLIVLFFGALVFVKLSSKGKVAAVFIDTRSIYSRLFKEDTMNQCIWRGKEDNPNREKYKLIADKSFELEWPGGFPWILRTKLKAWIYTRNNDEPWDPSNMKVVMSARMNRMISDEALLRTMWKDIRTATGIGQGGGSPMGMKLLLFLGFIALIGAIGALMTYNLGKAISTFSAADHSALTNITNMLNSLLSR
jgi:hypothetical protein